MDHKQIYSGIGSQKTPQNICLEMTQIADQLQQAGWKLRSGHADGADQAFEIGTNVMEIFLPWNGYNNASHGYPYHTVKPTTQVISIASRFHPNWDNLSDPVRLLMCRNVAIILGVDCETPSRMVICWTPGGRLTGGTAHGMRIAYAYDIPVFNLAIPEDIRALCEFV